MNSEKWDRRFLELARFISNWSKDPSTRTGAVITDNQRIVSVGYNGLPIGVEDKEDRLSNRELKYRLIVHCATPNHRTLTADLRWVELGSLKVGDELTGFDENILPGVKARQYRKSLVTAISYEKEPVYRIVMDTDQEIFTTADHKWLTTTSFSRIWKWMRTDELRTNTSSKYPSTKISKIIPVFKTATDYDSGWLAGLLDGEGCLTKHHAMHLAQRPGTVLDSALDILKERSQSHSLRLVSNVMSGGLGKKDCIDVHIRGSLPDRLAFLGTIRPKRLLGKITPDNFGQLSRRSKQSITHSIKAVLPAGKQEVCKITTSTGTLFIEGYPSHNCERNALLFAKSSVDGCTLYTYPFMSCAPCAGMVINAGIKRCVAPCNDNPRWQEDFRLTEMMFSEAGVELVLLDFQI